jgi:hypothetical protein
MNANLRITSIFFIETGTTNDMVARSLNSHVDERMMNVLADQTRQGDMIHADNLTGIAGKIITPGAQVDRFVNIANGWQNKRYRFVLHAVPDTGNLQSSMQYIYTGYSNSTGVVQVQNGGYDFDPNMQLFVNNRVTISSIMPNEFNTNGFFNVQNASHVIHPKMIGNQARPTFNPTNMAPIQVPSTIRPMDLMYALSSQETSQLNAQFVGDMRSAISTSLSRRTNQLPATYLQTSLDSLYRAVQLEDPNGGNHGVYSAAAAGAGASELSFYEDPLIGKISMGRTGYVENGYVTWYELKDVFPEITQQGIVKVINTGETKKLDIYQSNAGDFQPWYQLDPMGSGQARVDESMEAIVSTYLLQTLPAIMLQSLMSRITIRATNMTPTGQISVQVDPPVPLFGELPQGYIQQTLATFVRNAELSIFRDMPLQEGIPFSISAHIDAFGDSHIQISINGQPPVPYCSPTYADASFTPMVTSSQNVLNNIASDVKFMAKNLGVFGNGQNQPYPQF